jgi:lipopolysaccharide transport system ATP-binding protein
MSNIAIQVEDLSKLYRLGPREQYKTLRDSLSRVVTTTFQRFSHGSQRASTSFTPNQQLWALKDVNFEIKYGEVVGIIGPNGAGKSTLLKILSRITKPSQGYARIRGRVGSLLEVGTGFHPELTGRENIYLNGAILGMRKVEIRRKFDEIVDFAEVERFIDTPVKHYSSGMYVRLAFAVAASLEPEILIIDEVLAVGDVAFQKKCLGRMGDVAQEGRTVLFVSHNMDIIEKLCPRSFMFEQGQLVAQGESGAIIGDYLSRYSYRTQSNEPVDLSRAERTGSGEARFTTVQYSSLNQAIEFRPYPDGPLEFLLTIEANAPREVGSLAVFLCNQLGTKLVNADTVLHDQVIKLQKGTNRVSLKIEQLHLTPGIYRVGLWLADPISSRTNSAYDYIETAFEIEVVKPRVGESNLYAYALVTCDFKAEELI